MAKLLETAKCPLQHFDISDNALGATLSLPGTSGTRYSSTSNPFLGWLQTVLGLGESDGMVDSVAIKIVSTWSLHGGSRFFLRPLPL